MTETGLPYLVEESLGKQWYFTLSDQQKIQYTCKENGVWSETVPIDGQSVKFFRVTIDKRDKIYLLAYTLAKQLIYYEWNGDQWYQRMLYRVSSRFENISYLLILSTATHIHLFYYMENSLKRAQESFVHSYLENGRWKSDVLMRFLTDQSVVPQLILSDEKGNLLCVYTKTLRNHTHCYLTRFDNKHSVWSKPAVLFQKPEKCSSFNGFTDSTGILHMVWTEDAGEKYRLNYKKIDTEALNFSGADVCIWEGTVPMRYPCIFSGNGYHCFWIQDGKGMASHVEQAGQHWDAAREIPDQKLLPYIHIYKTLDGRSQAVLELGDGYPGFARSVGNSLAGRQENRPGSEKNMQNSRKEEDGGRPTVRPDASILQDLRQLSGKVDKATTRMDEFYNALYQLQDYIRQKDKSFFQIDAQIRKLSFEIEQLRLAKGSGRVRAAGYSVAPAEHSMEDQETSADRIAQTDAGSHRSAQEDDNPTDIAGGSEEFPGTDKNADKDISRIPPKNTDSGTGEIQLGNVSIRINQEEESEENT